jgi:hypothetical protein
MKSVFGSIPRVANLGLISREIKPSICTYHSVINDFDVGLFFCLIAGQNRIRGWLALKQVEGFSSQDHRSQFISVNQESVLMIHSGYDL